jgi:succinyl-CoA synthetase beta subunit
MKLYEFQGKELFHKFGIATPQSTLCDKETLPFWSGPCVLKAQVLSGGRGKAGGVVLCNDEVEQDRALKKLFGMTLKGEPVNAVLFEERVNVLREFYFSITFDGEAGTPLLIVSASGGVDIEVTADEHPERILRLPFDSLAGPQEYHFLKAARFAGTSRTRELAAMFSKLYKVYDETWATLVEVNPLAETPDGFVVLDAKVELDDDAEGLDKELRLKFQKYLNKLSGQKDGTNGDTITYVPLDGDIGMISDGAGTGMLTLDLLRDHGGKAANFCEMGGITSPEVIYSAMDQVMANPGIRSLLIVLIGGFNRMDEMAEGITLFVSDRALDIPLVVRLCGTMEEEGKKIMRTAGLPVYDDLETAIADAVSGKRNEGK